MKIKTLKIFTSNLAQQVAFYTETIGLPIIDKTTNSASFQVGKSILELQQSNTAQSYHFALNIPSNQENDALAWLKERVEVLKFGDKEIQDFEAWNAKAIYFYDRDHNIVEFIARKNLKNGSGENFSVKSLLNISEIGIPVNDIEVVFKIIKETASSIEIYDGGFGRFCAIGNEEGLFICINKNEKDWFPTNDKAYSSPFEITFGENKVVFSLEFKNGKIGRIAH